MAKRFFETIEADDKMIHKSISMGAKDWNLVDAYRLYGASQRKKEISVQKIIRKILIDHIKSDREFIKEQGIWCKKLEELQETAND